MDDDFNTPQAIAALFDLGREVNTLLNSGQAVSRATLEAIDGLYRELGGDVLGIVPDDLARAGRTASWWMAWCGCSSTCARRPARPATGPGPMPSATSWPRWASPWRTAQRAPAGG